MIYLIVLLIVALLGTHFILRMTERKRAPSAGPFRGRAAILLICVLLAFLFAAALGPIGPGGGHSLERAAMQTCRTIALAMFSYAQDHGSYPDGNSSTEVFQKLVDGNYVSDPKLFYIPLAGKTPPTGNNLKPENVSFDVTSGIQPDSSPDLPIVFITGFRMEYRAGGPAVRLTKSGTGWLARALGVFASNKQDGLAMAYKSNNAFFKTPSLRDGRFIVPGIVPPDFDSHGQTYRQLTPEGVLR